MGQFKFETCTSKQFVRHYGWVPEGKRRARKVATEKVERRLRYLTFCGEGAIDVKALTRAKVIKPSGDKRFDTVVFFDRTPEAVARTLENVAGATGLPTDFFDLMTAEVAAAANELPGNEFSEGEEESIELFTENRVALDFATFRSQFPFDIVNLDIERYLVIPSEQLPGKLMRAWDRLLELQKRGNKQGKKPYTLGEFTLFFTTRIGPPALPAEHKEQLLNVLQTNIAKDPTLGDILAARLGTADVGELYVNEFPEFMKLAVPKALVSRALKKDWILDPDESYLAFEFDRQTKGEEPYTMLHFVLNFRRCNPSTEAMINPDGPLPAAVISDYTRGVRSLFSTQVVDIDKEKKQVEGDLKKQLADLGVS